MKTRKVMIAGAAGFAAIVLGSGIALAQSDTPEPTVSITPVETTLPTTTLPPAEIIDAIVQESPDSPQVPRTEEPPPPPAPAEPPMAPVITKHLAVANAGVVNGPEAPPEALTPAPSTPDPEPTPAELPACPEVTYDGILPSEGGTGPIWSTSDGNPPSYDCNGPGHTTLP